MNDIGRKMAKGAAWMVFFKFTERSIGLVSTFILARLLIPVDFGLIAMAMSVIAFLEILSAFGFDVALIQNQTAQRKHYDTAWTYNVLLAVITAILLTIIAAPVAHYFFNEPKVEMIIYALAFGNMVRGFENIGIVAFRKDLTFNKEFKFLLTKKLAQFSTTIPLAFILGSYWALVCGMIIGWLVGVVLSYFVHPYRPKFSLAASNELFHFSKWLLINNIFNFIKIRSAHFIIGRFSGPKDLGLFTVADEISSLPTTELVAPINRAVFPGYVKFSHNLASMREGFLKVLGLIALFALPAGLGIAATAEPIVMVFLGHNWTGTIPYIEILAIFGAMVALQTNISSVFLALGKPNIMVALGTLHIVLLIPAIVIFVSYIGSIGAAWAYLAVTVIMLPVNYSMIMVNIKLSIMPIISVLWRPIIASIIMYFGVDWLLSQLLTNNANTLVNLVLLLVCAGFGALIYIVITIGLWVLAARPQSAEQQVLAEIKSKILHKFPTLFN